MNLKIEGHHVEVTPAMRGYVLNKLDRVMRHFDQVVDISVTLLYEKHMDKEHRNTAEIDLHVKGHDIHVEHTNGNMYATIDEITTMLNRQVRRYKDRIQDPRPGVCHKRTAGYLRPGA